MACPPPFKYISKTGVTGVKKDEATLINSALTFLDIVIIILVDGKVLIYLIIGTVN